MKLISRRRMLMTTGGLVTAATVAIAQSGTLQPRRPGVGGTDPGPRNPGAHLRLDPTVMRALRKQKVPVVPA